MTEYPPHYTMLEQVPPPVVWTSHSKPLTDEDVVALLTRWHFERVRYPGWVVAPENKRDAVRIRTDHWSDILLKHADAYSAADRILICRELNWRLEISMIPLFPVQIEFFTKALDELFDTLMNLGPIDVSNWLVFGQDKTVAVACAWLEVAFGLLREARETYDAVNWDELEQKISKLISRQPEYLDRYQYEMTLWAMWNVERGRAKSLLSEWQPSDNIPLAAIWKAGLLAELNEIAESRDLLSQTLQQIRIAQQVSGQKIELFSLEGWCTYLIASIDLCSDYNKRLSTRREFLLRWRQLKMWECDPFETKMAFETALSGPAPEIPGRVKRIRHFDPGQFSISWRLSSTINSYLPAFAYIRFFEQAGIPMRLPNAVNVAGDGLKSACLWIAPFIPFWSPALLIRANKIDDFTGDEALLSRTQIALMDSSLTTRLYDWCIHIWDRETSNIGAPSFTMRDEDSLLGCLAEVLSRLAFRLNGDQLQESFRRAVAIQPWAGHPAYRLYSACRHWFLRLYQAADPALLVDWLPDLIMSPLVQHLSASEDEWDPMDEFPSRRIVKMTPAAELVSAIKQSTEWLLKRAESEVGPARNRAVLRLARLHEADKLDDTDSVRFAQVLWSERAESGLPAVRRMTWSGFLSFPKPTDVDAVSIVKRLILELPPLQGQGIICNENGTVSIRSPGEPVSDLILQCALNTRTIAYVLDEPDGVIEWTDEEAALLTMKATEWWQRAKQACAKHTSPFVEIDKSRLGTLLALFLTRVVVATYVDKDDQTWQDFFAWLADIQGNAIYPAEVLPYVAAKRTESVAEIVNQLITDLNSDDELAIASAANAVRHYVVLYRAGSVLLPYSDLVSALVERVAYRRRVALSVCILRLTQLLAQNPFAINATQLSNLSQSLVAWLEQLPLELGAAGEFTEYERPAYRRHLAILAGVLWALYESAGNEIPSSINSWKESSESDPLPEVRRAFDEGMTIFTDAQIKERS